MEGNHCVLISQTLQGPDGCLELIALDSELILCSHILYLRSGVCKVQYTSYTTDSFQNITWDI